MRQIIVDTETTGLEPSEGHRIIEIGCVELINRRFTGNNFHTYLNPDREIDAGALKVHGISASFLLNKPRFADIYKQLIDYLGNSELIIHNAVFDLGFLNYELALVNSAHKRIEQSCQILDTLQIARKMHPGQRNSLDALCKRYGIDNSERELHGALLDAKILGQVYLAMTGGQNSLFDTSFATKNIESAISATQVHRQEFWDLPIIYATEAESKAHEDYLKTLAKENNG